VLADVGEAFDAKRHTLGPDQTLPTSGVVEEVLASGYSYQGALIRPALVRLQAEALPADSSLTPDSNQLPLASAPTPVI
jgi:hypothetical protein